MSFLTPKRILHRLMLIFVLFVIPFGPVPPPAQATQGRQSPPGGYPSARVAIQAALDGLARQGGPALFLGEVREAGGYAYGTASRGAEFRVVLAEYAPALGWLALVPDLDGAEAYNQALERSPEALIDEHFRAFLWQYPGGPQLNQLANFTGHKLPWQAGLKGYVTNKEGQYHQNQIDFDIQGLAKDGDVYATKPGVVWFVKQSNNEGPCNPSDPNCWQKANLVIVKHAEKEFSWYVHLAYNSVPVSVGQSIGYGTKIGVEGKTGIATAVHLHYMASTGHTKLTDPSNPNAAPWATGITPVDFDEYSWNELVVSYASPYTSQNSGDPMAAPAACPALNGVILYRRADFACTGQAAGQGYVMRPGAGFQNLTPAFNDAAVSIRIPAGWSVMLYEDINRGGGRRCVEAPGDSDLRDDLFDTGAPLEGRVSSFDVYPDIACPGGFALDTLPPSGDYTSPASGIAVGQTVDLAASASDERSGVREVHFRARWGDRWRTVAVDRSAPYEFTWDLCAGPVPDGDIELGLEVYDNAGNRYSTGADRPNTHIYKSAACVVPGGIWSAQYWNGPDLNGLAMLVNEETSTYLVRDWQINSPGGGLPADGWSARFTRSFLFPGGTYRFHCQSDSACRVWLDNVVVIDGWAEMPPEGLDWTGLLSPGLHEVRIEYVDLKDTAWLEVWWQGPGFLPLDSDIDPDQWFAEYWPGGHWNGPPAIRRSEGELLDHNWAEGGPAPGFSQDTFLARFQRNITLPCGEYRFSIYSDDGLRLWLNDQKKFDQWYLQTVDTSFTVSLPAGTHTLRAEYFEETGSAGLSVQWEKIKACATSVSTPPLVRYAARPGAALYPSIPVTVMGGGLFPADGDQLERIGGDGLGALSPQPLLRPVLAGGRYWFDTASNGSFQMNTTPTTEGVYTGQWQVRAFGAPLGAPTEVQLVVDNTAPAVSIDITGSYLTTPAIPVPLVVSDALSGVDQVQVFAGYRDGDWAWRLLGWDGDGSDGWGLTWDASGVPDQDQVAFFVHAWDKAGNLNSAVLWGQTLDRSKPDTWLSPLVSPSENTRVRLYFNGSDSGSGLSHYDVQVSVNQGSSWQDWLTGLDPATLYYDFYGDFEHSYAFRMRGVDRAGNVESYPSVPETSVYINPCQWDDYEDDDSQERASELTAGGPGQAHNLCGLGDQDWAWVALEAGQTYLIFTSRLGPLTDTVLGLYDAQGNLLVENDDIAPGHAFNSRIRWIPAEDGVVYLNVRYRQNLAAGSAATYHLEVQTEQALFLPSVLH